MPTGSSKRPASKRGGKAGALPKAALTVTIANGQTVSTAADLAGASICGVWLPAAFTGTTLTFQASRTVDGTYGAVQGVSLTPVAAGQFVPVDPTKFYGVRFVKVVSGSAEGAARSVILATRVIQ